MVDIKTKIDGAVKAWIVATLIDFGKDLGSVLIQEIGLALQQWNAESKTPDGWTEIEYLTYIQDRLYFIRLAEIGNAATDKVCDIAIDWIRGEISERLERKKNELEG